MLNIKENITLAPYTVFKIGGSSDYFCEVKNTDELKEAVAWAGEKKLPYFIMGAGSNLLVSDEGYRGLVIKMNLQELKMEDGKIYAGSGVSMARAVNFAIENKLGGFEWAIGVPGSIGGSVFGNAGCYGNEMKDVVESVGILKIEPFSAANSEPNNFKDIRSATGARRAIFQQENTRVLEIALAKDECDFKYRHSAFKKHPEWIILGATLKLPSSDPNESRAKVLEYSKKRTQSQDIGSKCAGCIFKNPEPGLSAGALIEKAGLKGRSVGGAIVSEKHANFIVNRGGATARDVKELIGVIKDEVMKASGIALEEEIRMI